MRELSLWPAPQRRAVVGVFTDIDDTLTTSGAITPDALRALADLKAAGLYVIAITGRPVGWSEAFALQWPVDAIVAENGAVALTRAVPGAAGPATTRSPGAWQRHGALLKLYQQDDATRSANFEAMQRVAARVLREVADAKLAQDSAGRETDIAIDHSEFVQLPTEQIGQVLAIMHSEGMTASVSSIHINGWYGAHNKLAGARWIAGELLGVELDGQIDRWVFVGDSTNDQIMFEHFPHSVGVANIRRFESELSHQPRYITRGERGAGFAEVAAAILEAR